MKIKSFVFNYVEENTYLVWDETLECAIIDAGCMSKAEFNKLDRFIVENKLNPVRLLNTHCHFDHIWGVEACRRAYTLKWEAHPLDDFLVEGLVEQGSMFGVNLEPVANPDKPLYDGEVITFGNLSFKVLLVGGHSPGCVCFYDELSKTLFSGDVLFQGSIGRTDLAGGSYSDLVNGIKSKLFVLPDDVAVYPGHGPSTTISYEKNNNMYVR